MQAATWSRVGSWAHIQRARAIGPYLARGHLLHYVPVTSTVLNFYVNVETYVLRGHESA